MKRFGISALIVVGLLVSACGKNEAFVPGGYYPPVNQAPMPPGGGYYPPSTQYPGGGPSPYFRPQLPQGYPNQYTPFLPLDNYMRRTPPMQQMWVNVWVNWQDYSYQRGYDQYDFSRFWYEYCPQQFYGTQYWDMYNYFDQNVYQWADPNMQWGQSYDPYYFWQNYDYMPYQPIDSYGYCDSYCY
jgi:hypothetical protein